MCVCVIIVGVWNHIFLLKKKLEKKCSRVDLNSRPQLFDIIALTILASFLIWSYVTCFFVVQCLYCLYSFHHCLYCLIFLIGVFCMDGINLYLAFLGNINFLAAFLFLWILHLLTHRKIQKYIFLTCDFASWALLEKFVILLTLAWGHTSVFLLVTISILGVFFYSLHFPKKFWSWMYIFTLSLISSFNFPSHTLFSLLHGHQHKPSPSTTSPDITP